MGTFGSDASSPAGSPARTFSGSIATRNSTAVPSQLDDMHRRKGLDSPHKATQYSEKPRAQPQPTFLAVPSALKAWPHRSGYTNSDEHDQIYKASIESLNRRASDDHGGVAAVGRPYATPRKGAGGKQSVITPTALSLDIHTSTAPPFLFIRGLVKRYPHIRRDF